MPDIKSEVLKTDDLVLAKFYGGIIKRSSANEFDGYAIRWHDPNRKDLHGEWFSKRTNRMLKQGYPIIGKPVNYQHNMHKDFGTLPLGLLTFTDEDDIGQFVRGEINELKEYEAMLEEIGRVRGVKMSHHQVRNRASLAVKAVDTLFNNVAMRFSGGFDPSTWVVDKDGHIDQAGLIHLATTPTPADDMNPLLNFKSMWKQVHELEHDTSTFDMSQTAPRKDASNGHKDAKADDDSSTTDNVDNEETKMNEQEIRELIRIILEEMRGDDSEKEFDEDEALAAVDTEKIADDEEMTDEEKSAEITKSVITYVEEKRMARDTAHSQARKAAHEANVKFARNQKGDTSKIGGFSTDDPNETKATFKGIEVRSKFADWTPADFSFAASIANMTGGTNRQLDFRPDQKFYREFADKAEKAYVKGDFHLGQKAIRAINAIKADELDYSTQAGFGDEWVFTGWSDNVWDKPRLDNVVVPAFQSIEMPSNPYEYPVESTDPTVFAVTETQDEDQLGRNDSNAALPDSKIATAKVQFNAKKHALRVNISAELEEDGIARLMPKFREQAERTILDAHDNVVLNGDTSTSGNINLDGGTPTTQNYVSYDGIIHQALVTATTNAVDAGGAAPTLAHIRNIRSLLGNAQGFNPRNLAIFTDFSTYMKLLSIDAVVTVDKIGAQATVVTGSLGQIDGINIFVSGQMALADTDGKITSAGNVTDTGRLAMVYTPDWFIGFRRRVVQHVNFLPYADAWELIMTVRHALTARSYSAAGAQQSTDDSVSILYNIGV